MNHRLDTLDYAWDKASNTRGKTAEKYWKMADLWLRENGFEEPEEDFEACDSVCPGNRPCCCNGLVRHYLHICSWSGCLCHSMDRYEGRLPWGEDR